MTQKDYKTESCTTHTPWAEDGKVFLSNDEDSYYCEEFKSRTELEYFIEQLHAAGNKAWPSATNNICFHSSNEEVVRLDKEGFHYKGEFISDAGEAHRLMVEFLKQNTARPEQEEPTDEELDELFVEIDQSGESESWRAYARAVLTRWGK